MAGLQMTLAQATEEDFALYLLPAKIRTKDLSGLSMQKVKRPRVPLFTADDVFSYVRDRHEIVLHHRAGQRIKDLDVPASGRPFIVYADSRPIYTGVFRNGSSPIGFSGAAIDVSDLKGDFPVLKLEFDQRTSTPDPRHDSRIFEAMQTRSVLLEELWIYGKCTSIYATGKRRQSFVFGFDITSVARSTYDAATVSFEAFDDYGPSLRAALAADMVARSGLFNQEWRLDTKKEILLKFLRRVGTKPGDPYEKHLESFEIKD